jgi:hypothetical protein
MPPPRVTVADVNISLHAAMDNLLYLHSVLEISALYPFVDRTRVLHPFRTAIHMHGRECSYKCQLLCVHGQNKDTLCLQYKSVQ